MNPLINTIARSAVDNMPQMQMLQQFAQFRQGWTDQGARQKLQQLMQSGQIDAGTIERAKAMATQFSSLIK